MVLDERGFSALWSVSGRFFRLVPGVVLCVCLGWGCGSKKESQADAKSDAKVDAKDAATGDLLPDRGIEPAEAKSYRELIGGEITQKVRFILDAAYEGEVDLDALKEYVLSRKLREADEFPVPALPENWWDDYQDTADIMYYSSEWEFSEESPYPGSVFMPQGVPWFWGTTVEIRSLLTVSERPAS